MTAPSTPHRDAAPRPHTTHFDDCGCLSTRLKADAARWRECAEALEAAVNRLLRHTGHNHPGARRDGTLANCKTCAANKQARAALARFDAQMDGDADDWCTCNDENTCEGHRA